MLFNSYEFILFFLPIVLIIFYIFGNRFNHRLAVAWLVVASLFYYAWWNPAYVCLIIFSLLFNYGVGLALAARLVSNRLILGLGIAVNLALLGYFKYANFFLENINYFADTKFSVDEIILPLGISFFTFQQIAYLVDSYKKKTQEYNFLNYALFVSFFPQLIAGPIVHHSEMMPQFAKTETFRINAQNLEHGLTTFSLGLFKKVIIADGVSRFATPLFSAAANQQIFTMVDAWIGSLAYAFQLYFDFSAYSDMAIGAALMFGVRLPINFNSPYKATNIIEFWSRWHMTLSRFLRDYLYIPLGGNRHGQYKRYRNLIVTMLLGGLWHGAGWTFIIWGGVHALYLMLNHFWRTVYERLKLFPDLISSLRSFFSRLFTFIAVVIAWVIFRSEDINSAFAIISAMFGFGENVQLNARLFSHDIGLITSWFICLGIVVWGLPNVHQWMGYKADCAQNKNDFEGSSTGSIAKIFRPKRVVAVCSSLVMLYTVLNLMKASEFLYFQF